MSTIRTLLYTLVFYLGCLIVVPAAALAIPFGQRPVIAMSRLWALWHRWCVRWLLGIVVRVDGVLPQSGAIVAIKHEAFLETSQTLVVFDAPAVVFKQELLSIPLWGRAALAHGVIPVAREAGAAALRTMLKAARDAIAAGRPIIIFPEGTRVPPGESPPLRSGIAGLYKLLKLPIVPVAVDSGRLWPRQGFAKHAGVVTLKVGEPIPPGLDREEVEARVHAGINALNR